MPVKKDYDAIASGIVNACGGVDNISGVSHCMTRLRVTLKNSELFVESTAKEVQGVLNVVVQNGEYQFVIGQDVASLYETFEKRGDVTMSGEVDDENTAKEDLSKDRSPKAIANAILSFIGGTFSPVIPVLVAGGLTGAVLTLLTNFCGVTTDSGAYQLIYSINQATFYFLPIFIGFSAATRLKSNGFLGAFLGAILLYQTAVAGASDPSMRATEFFGLPVAEVAYNSTVFPIILGVLFMSVVYRWLQHHMPVFLRTIFVPLITILISAPVTLIVLGPIGNTLGTLLCDGVFAIYRAAPPLAVAFFGAFTPWLVFFGMNNATYPIIFALFAEVNSDPLVCTGMAPANVAVGGACLAAALIEKKVEDRSVALGAGVTALCGITEPGVYGVLFTKRFPLVGAMIGGGIGGLLAGFLGMTQYVISTPGFISLPAYIDPSGSSYNLVVAVVVMLVATVTSFAVTNLLGKRALKKQENQAA